MTDPIREGMALLEKATPGPWHARRNDQDDGRIHYDVDDADEHEVACVRHALKHDAALIVWLRNHADALLRVVAAARRVPIMRRSDSPPYSTCLGCGATDEAHCADGCWVNQLDAALEAIHAG